MQRFSKRTIVTAVTVLVIIVALTFTALILVHNATKKATPAPATPTAKSAADVIKALQSKAKDDAAALGGSTLVVGNGTQTQPLYVKLPSGNAYAQVTTTNVAILTSASGFGNSQLSTTTDTIRSLLAAQGLTSTGTIADKTVIAGYASGTTTCQLKELPPTSGPVIELQVLCANASDYKSQLDSISTLIELWPDASKTAYDLVSQTTSSNGTYTVTLLYPSKADLSAPHILVFVKDSSWHYIGDASTGTAVTPNEKLIINQDIQNGLNNAKYGSFLHDVLFDQVKS